MEYLHINPSELTSYGEDIASEVQGVRNTITVSDSPVPSSAPGATQSLIAYLLLLKNLHERRDTITDQTTQFVQEIPDVINSFEEIDQAFAQNINRLAAGFGG